jgi:hypothetical protein
MEAVLTNIGSYLTPENIAWALGMVLGLEQILGFSKLIKSNSTTELIWRILKLINSQAKKKISKAPLLVLLAFSLSHCASIENGKISVEGIKADLETASTAIDFVKDLLPELVSESTIDSDRAERYRERLVLASALLTDAKELIEAGQGKDASIVLFKINKIMAEVSQLK